MIFGLKSLNLKEVCYCFNHQFTTKESLCLYYNRPNFEMRLYDVSFHVDYYIFFYRVYNTIYNTSKICNKYKLWNGSYLLT